MTEHDASLHAHKKGVLSWLGLHWAKGGDLSDLSCLAEHLRTIFPGSRADLIASIAEFLAKHDLDLCDRTLAAAYDYVAAQDPLLVRQIDEREMIGQKITFEWLGKLRDRRKAETETTELCRAIERLEKHVVEFSEAAVSARRATRDYGGSLKGHVEQLKAVPDPSRSVMQILGMVRSMIERTSEMEKEMARSERQSESLRRSLETALKLGEEDFLTGLPNRRAFEMTFESEYRNSRQSLEPLVVAFCDIDHFKRINDTHGHDTGDRVLKAVARCLSGISSERCYIARHGGEEFVVLFKGKSLDDAKQLLDYARSELAERRLVNRITKTPIGYITFSAGIADVFAYPNRRAALKAADAALYRAKGQGRNQVLPAYPATTGATD